VRGIPEDLLHGSTQGVSQSMRSAQAKSLKCRRFCNSVARPEHHPERVETECNGLNGEEAGESKHGASGTGQQRNRVRQQHDNLAKRP
jgi:hypothetical protein